MSAASEDMVNDFRQTIASNNPDQILGIKCTSAPSGPPTPYILPFANSGEELVARAVAQR
jgi:hypothetical protein